MQPRTLEKAFRASIGQRRPSLLFTCHCSPRTFGIKRRFHFGTVVTSSINITAVCAIVVGGASALASAGRTTYRPPTSAISVAFMRPLSGSRSASFPGWWSGFRQASPMRGAGSKPPAAPSLEASFCSWGLRLLLRWSASSASAATSRGTRRGVAPRRAARRTRRVGLRRSAASACVFARQSWLLRLTRAHMSCCENR